MCNPSTGSYKGQRARDKGKVQDVAFVIYRDINLRDKQQSKPVKPFYK